jgi:hypothetical protein
MRGTMRGAGSLGVVVTVLACLVILPDTALAQRDGVPPYDAPSFNTPYGEDGFGLFLNIVRDVNDVAGEATYRWSGSVVDLGLRGGLTDVDSNLGLFGGIDIKNEFVRATESFPLAVAWVTGGGITWVFDADVGLFRIPFGFSFGRAIDTESGDLTITPYVYPRIAVDIPMSTPGADTDVHFDVDLGADFKFAPRWFLRFGATVGHSGAIGFGIAFE